MTPAPQAVSHALTVYLGADQILWAVDPSDGNAYRIMSTSAQSLYVKGIGAANPAMIDHAMYADQAGAGISGIDEAPLDGAQYVRQDGAWVAIKPAPQPFAPSLNAITPSSVPAGSPDTIVTFTGTGFVNQEMQPCFGDQLMSWYTPMVQPNFISPTQFQATLGANLLANPTSFFLWIQNTSGPDSNNLEFDVTTSQPP